MTFKREKVVVNSMQGPVETDCIFRLGEMGITRHLGNRGWVLTHMPTGFCAPVLFPRGQTAIDCCKELDEIVDWPGAIKTLAAGGTPNAMSEIKRILTKHDIRLAKGPTDVEELARRVKALEGA